jgi:hypothetical protein
VSSTVSGNRSAQRTKIINSKLIGMRIFITLVAIFILLQTNAQDSLLSNKTIFKDGVYLTYRNFATNNPGLKLNEISYSSLTGGIPTQRYLYNFKLSPDIIIDFDTIKIWGICLNGVPYINQSYFFESDPNYTKLNEGFIIEEHAFTFARIMMIGHLCHFTAEGENNGSEPLNDLLPEINDFRLKGTANGNRISQQYLLKVSTGEIVKFKSSNLQKLISDDSDLYKRFDSMLDGKKKKEMFNIFREYNSKHPIFVK